MANVKLTTTPVAPTDPYKAPEKFPVGTILVLAGSEQLRVRIERTSLGHNLVNLDSGSTQTGTLSRYRPLESHESIELVNGKPKLKSGTKPVPIPKYELANNFTPGTVLVFEHGGYYVRIDGHGNVLNLATGSTERTAVARFRALDKDEVLHLSNEG